MTSPQTPHTEPLEPLPRYTLALDDEELLHLHACLTYRKNEETRDGQVWPLHDVNARLRTRLENLR